MDTKAKKKSNKFLTIIIIYFTLTHNSFQSVKI